MIGETARAAFESAIRRFEDAWRGRQRPDIAGYLPSDAPDSVRLLLELVHIDLEFRLRAGEQARVEDYLERFPELWNSAPVLDLIAAEFALRNRHSPPAWPEEFLLRFPEFMGELRARLPVGGTGWFSATRPAERPGVPLSGPPVITGYEIEGELGRGGMGVVYKARDLLLNRIVAVKTFATVPRPESCARFAREAEAIARLDHPNIVPVYEVGEWRASGDGASVPFFVMKWYPGGGLDARPAGPGSNPAAHARTVETIARAVHHAHQRGVLHRDLKPSNILLDDAGSPHVADFGLAGRVDPEAPTVTAVVAGTPAYMAPEQARNPKQVSTAADVYGLGAILYHQLTGRAPFAAETPLATLELVANATAARPSEVNPAVSRDLDTICLKCLEKEPARRYASAAELADDLERYRKGLPIAARPAQAWELAWRRARRHPATTALILTTLAALVTLIGVLAESNARVRAKEEETKAAYLRECATRYALEDTLARETAARNELKATLAREQRALYLERVTAAGRLYEANRLPEAWALLASCPPEHRGWEWRYLDALRQAKRVVLGGHTATVTRVGFLSDGRLISADARGFLHVWEEGAEAPKHTWTVSPSAVFALATHPTKNWVAAGSPSGVWVVNADTGRTVGRFSGSGWAQFSPDGKLLATAEMGTIRLWVVPDAEPPARKDAHGKWVTPVWEQAGTLDGHTGVVLAGVFTPNGKQLISSAVDRTIRTWELAGRREVDNRTVPMPVSGLALAGDGDILAEAHYGAVLFTDLTTGKMRDRLEYPTGERTAVAPAPGGRTIAVSGVNGEVVVWDVVGQRPTRVYRGHAGRVQGLAFGPGNRLATGGGDQTVRVWNTASEPEVRTVAWVGPGVGGLGLSPDGAQVTVGPRTDRAFDPQAVVLEAATGRELFRAAGYPDVAIHPTTGRLFTTRMKGGVHCWDGTTGSPIWEKPFSAPRTPPVAYAPGTRRMAVAADGSVLALWDPRAGGVQLWNARDGSDLGVLETGKVFVHAVDVSPDGARVLVGTADGPVMFDVPTRARVPWGPGDRSMSVLRFSPDGRVVACVEPDRVIRLRDAATGREIRPFVGTAVRVNVICFSPDSTRLVTGGADRTVRVWDVETGRELLSLPGPTEGVTGLAWDANHDRIFALDWAVRVWETQPPK